ncbi:MAG: ShlB/FhaC/HecB family hemolysin secretion/activation protein [Syntrophobacteraceae bacterium]
MPADTRTAWNPHLRRTIARLAFLSTLILLCANAFALSEADQAAVKQMMADWEHAEIAEPPPPPDAEPTFAIQAFVVVGNTLFSEERLREVLAPYGGPKKTAEDVELARTALETFIHEAGYPTVMVSVPQQTVESGMITLEVMEMTVGNVKITGNRYFKSERIRKRVPSLAPGEIIWVPRLQEELTRANGGTDVKITPSMAPGEEPGTVDVELAVEDHFPLHASLELSNRKSPNTSDLRLNGLIRYDNLWQMEHSASLQYQTSPLDFDEVEVIAASYVMPTPWKDSHSMALYSLWTDSNSAFGTGFKTIGKGWLVGLRYVMPLPAYLKYNHSVTLGIDYKDFEDTLTFGAESPGTDHTPVKYLPASLAYSASIADSGGITQFSAGINAAFRGVVSHSFQFENKRFKARSDYIFATGGLERIQKLPGEWSLYLKADGQVSDQPLISNEQYAAGGMESVRGYLESEVLGDDAFHATAELNAPDLVKLLKLGDKGRAAPYVFYDMAFLRIQKELPLQDDDFHLSGTGLGVRGNVTRWFDYDLCWAVALYDTEHTEMGKNRYYFNVKYHF